MFVRCDGRVDTHLAEGVENLIEIPEQFFSSDLASRSKISQNRYHLTQKLDRPTRCTEEITSSLPSSVTPLSIQSKPTGTYHAFHRKIPDPVVLVWKTIQHGRDDLLEVRHGVFAESDCRRCQTDQPTIPSRLGVCWVEHGVCLIDNLRDPGELFGICVG